jgi:DNA-binding FadR family transcriptional regulator
MVRKPASFADVHAAVFARLVQGSYRPTHRIAIAGLAQSLGVSTTPVREALRQLAGRDIIVERHREGFYLAPLNARAIASLYAAHAHWLAQALDRSAGRQPARHPRGLWRLFDASAADSRDLAIVAVRRYLDDRLAVLRRHETALLRDMTERGQAFAEAIAAGDLVAARAVATAFHQACQDQSDQLAAAFDPQG